MNELRMRLEKLAHNLCWAWNRDFDRIFRSIDVELWRAVNHNPIAFLQDVDPALLRSGEKEPRLMAQVVRVEQSLTTYLASSRHWAAAHAPGLVAHPVAYFSPEFALHESLPIYSGGLGALAGDHLKSCSDLGVPVYGVTLLYRQGYFTQQIDAQGRQQEVYQELDTNRVLLEPLTGVDGRPLEVQVQIAEELASFGLWGAQVGRCRLVLLDVGTARTSEELTNSLRLYGGDRTTRMLQELALGVGGHRALRALGLRPGVIHLNEGHSAFALLEAVACHMEETGLDFENASSEVSESVVFTTHTPVEAGHDRFVPDMALRYLRPLQQRLHLSDTSLLGLGRVNPHDDSEPFCMTVLALKLARRTNAVSSLHGIVTRRMWHGLWPDKRVPDVPIGHITNGAHTDTWLAGELSQLYGDVLGSDWKAHQCRPELWRAIEGLDAFALWSIKVALKRRLFDFIERRLRARQERLGVNEPLPTLREDALTIGFARRFAMYKRGALLFEHYDRAKRLLTHPERPVQVIFAGKAHPADEPGKSVLQKLFGIGRDSDLLNHVVVIEDYDMNLSRHLIEGCDLWLNAPRRPLEACGTSGMKAVFNGTLNCSTLDGWWDEAYDTQNGFAYGERLTHVDAGVQDRRDAEGLLAVLEHEVVPAYYERSADVPVAWLERVKHALKTLAWRYNSDRMVMDYVKRMYLPASQTLTAEMP